MAATSHPIDNRGPIARHYRNLRRGYGDGAYPDGAPMPARYALAVAKASARGSELHTASKDDTWHGSYARHWVEEIGAGCVVDVWQVSDDEPCDCWEWAKDNPRDDGREEEIPNHGHFGMVAQVSWHGRELTMDGLLDSCWGYVWDWPGQDDDAELTYAWESVAEPVIDAAREMVGKLPAWVVAQYAAWDDSGDES